jgi:hypothetical protein
MKTGFVITASLIVISAVYLGIFHNAIAKETPYQAGYDHGCDDAKVSKADARYINQPDKGPSFHTQEFMSGYNAGFSACSDGGSSPSSGGNTDNSGASSSSNSEQSQSYKDGFAVGKSRAIEAIQELHDGKNDKVDEKMKENVLAQTRISAVDCLMAGTRLYFKTQHQTSD